MAHCIITLCIAIAFAVVAHTGPAAAPFRSLPRNTYICALSNRRRAHTCNAHVQPAQVRTYMRQCTNAHTLRLPHTHLHVRVCTLHMHFARAVCSTTQRVVQPSKCIFAFCTFPFICCNLHTHTHTFYSSRAVNAKNKKTRRS